MSPVLAMGQCAERTGVEGPGQEELSRTETLKTMLGLLFRWPTDEAGEVIFVSPTESNIKSETPIPPAAGDAVSCQPCPEIGFC